MEVVFGGSRTASEHTARLFKVPDRGRSAIRSISKMKKGPAVARTALSIRRCFGSKVNKKEGQGVFLLKRAQVVLHRLVEINL
jgi:hypothetical protein